MELRKRQLKPVMALLLVMSMLMSMVHVPTTSYAAEPQMIKYDFRKAGINDTPGIPEGFVVEGATSNYPKVEQWDSFGIALQTSLEVPSRTIQLPIPASGTYQVYFKGYQSVGSGIGQLEIDGMNVGNYDFYAADYMMGSELELGKVNLKSGIRKLKFTAVGKNDASTWYYMQPSELKLLELAPELESVSIAAPTSLLAVNEQIQLQVSGLLSNENAADLTGAEIVFESSDDAVVSVDQDGMVTAQQYGNATIKATVTLDGIAREGTVALNVLAGMGRIEMSVDNTSIHVGRHSYVTLSAFATDSTLIDLNGVSIGFNSSNPAVASVDNNGIVVAKSAGKTTISASVTWSGITTSDSQEVEVTNKQIIPQNIPVYADKWSIIHAAAETPQIDGLLNESTWNEARTLSGFVTAFENHSSALQTEVKVLYDADHIYFGLQGALSEATDSDFVELYILSKDSKKMYIAPLSINNGRRVISEHHYGGSTVKNLSSSVKVNQNNRNWTAEVAIPLKSVKMQGIGSGEELRINVVRHQSYSAPVSSWFPLKTTTYQDVTGDNGFLYFITNSDQEGRFGKLYLDRVPEDPQISTDKVFVPWYPNQLTMAYLGYMNKRVVIPDNEFDISNEQLQLKWITPSGVTYLLDSPSIEKSGNQVSIEFVHPRASEDGSYQLQMVAHSPSTANTRIALISFDREDMIQAGDRTLNEPDYTAPPVQSVDLTPPSPEVQRLLALIPSNTGVFWAGLPDQPALSPYQLFDWNPENPDQLTSKYSSLVYPNAQYPEDKMLTAVNRKGETVEYPYYENNEGKKFFITAHLWYKKREYVMNQAEILAKTDPVGAARILYKLAQAYEGYVPVYDDPWNSKPLSNISGPPNPYYGGIWEWWYFMDIKSLNRLSRAYATVKSTNAFERLSQEAGENVRAKIVEGMFIPSVEFVRTYANRNTNMDYHVWQGLLEMGRAIDRPDYVHDAMERLAVSVSSQYLFDGFWNEVSMSYHDQSAGGSAIVAGMLNGWTDPAGFVSQRTGERLQNLNMDEQLPILKKSKDLLRSLTYPNGKYVPLGDTWAYGGQANPILGSLLQPAAGIARLALGDGMNQSQLYMTFSPKYGHDHYDPLNLNLYSNGQELIPDLGYTHTKYRQWATSTMGHNTVVVDGKDMQVNSQSQSGGSLALFAPADDIVKIMEAREEKGYAGVDEYRRQPWYITFPGGNGDEGYVLDIFRVSGGSRHEYTLQGDANHDAVFETDMNLTDYGPYLLPAGTQVVPPTNEYEQGSAGNEYYGYMYLRDVKQAELSDDTYSMTLVTKENEDNRSNLQITGLLEPGHNELFLSRSPSIRNTRVSNIDTNDRADEFTMPKFVLRREGNNLKSTFVTALEPYAAGVNAKIQKVERLELDQAQEGDVAVAITYGTTKDIILSSPQGSETLLVAGNIKLDGKMGFIRLEDGIVTKMMLMDGTSLKYGNVEVSGAGAIVGDIQKVLRKAEGAPYDAFVTAADVPVNIQGQYIVVDHPDGTSHGYLIQSIVKDSGKSVIQIEGEPGFEVYPDGISQLKFFPATGWTGAHTFRISNIETDMSDDVPTVDSIHLGAIPAMKIGATAQLSVTAAYSDGTIRDASADALFESSKPEVASVNASGVVKALRSGETSITATLNGKIANVQITVLSSDSGNNQDENSGGNTSPNHGQDGVQPDLNGNVIILLEEGKPEVSVATDVLAVAKQLTVIQGDAAVTLSKDAIKQILQQMGASGVGSGNQVQMSLNANWGNAEEQALARAREQTFASLTAASKVYDFQMHAEPSGVKLESPVTVRLAFDPQADVGLLGVYMLGENGKLVYVGGKIKDGRIEAELARPGRLVVLAYDKTFDDVPANHWANRMLKEMAARHLIEGGSDTKYEPSRNVTRAEFTVLLVRILGLKAGGEQRFVDVDSSAWYADSVSAAAAAGLVRGRGDMSFEPDQNITREEMVVMLVRAYMLTHGNPLSTGAVSRFIDRNQVSTWAQADLDLAAQLGLVSGRGNSQFAPKVLMNRAEAANAVYNLLKLQV
ncbi:S-layer homology domain-containing protein [Paenibacillus eucommiae]|uniref:SLH domain-containing protein n=1 Tax=Paenibacillus eucommiae TaxID=1355755 RepID=A0ABS4INT5_9BACL|nr:S-layer homology domain-containing protein [Paenibacillus eucommiae]MBP1988840.1 hypothetical protein [Paenibacillus eucommiae]